MEGNSLKRDDDLIRTLLFAAENFERAEFARNFYKGDDATSEQSVYHIRLCCDAGYMADLGGGKRFKLTNDGHDFLAAVRDDDVWSKTKSEAKKVGGVTLDMLTEIAKSLVKARLSEALRLPI